MNRGSVPLLLRGQAEAGERVLAHAVKLAQLGWGNRLVAAYAIGSLAHGGFSAHVSDVDLGLVVDAPLGEADTKAIDRLSSEAKAGGYPLAGRLSVFWGSLATLSGTLGGGRFPPVDVLDLKQSGRLLSGQNIRAQIRAPTLRELVVSGAEFALEHLSTPETLAYLLNPGGLASASTRKLTKLVLYPVRFLFTARTGKVGINDRAVEHFSAMASGPTVELARKGLEWRFEPPGPGDRAAVELLRNGVLPLYRMFLADYERRLREYGEPKLAQAYREWRERLD